MNKIQKNLPVVFRLILCFLLIGFLSFRLVPAEFRGSRLYNAAASGNLLLARVLVLSGSDVNYRRGNGTPLHAAAGRGDIAFMRFLLDHGAKVDSVGKFGITPLYRARMNSQSEAERFLISRGANPDTSHVNEP